MAAQCPMRWETTAQHWWFATPLDWATANGYFDVVRELLSLDGNLLIMLTSLRRIRRLEAAWEDKATSIDAAKGRGLVARELMGECETSDGNSLIDAGYGGWLLYTAAAAGDVELARCLLKRKPLLALGEGEYGVSDMLYAAARSKNAEIFREILGLAHDIKCLGCDQEDDAAVYESSPSFEMMSRAVHAAARGGSVEILRELFKNCHDVAWYRDCQGSTALHSAASKGQLEVVEELLLASPHLIESTDYQGNTALHVAAYSGHFVILKKLLLSFPPLLLATNNDGNTLLHMAVAGFIASGSRLLDKHLDLMRHLVSDETVYLPTIVNCQNKEGRTAMHMAVLGKVFHEKLLELLLSVPRLDINICDRNEMSAVDVLELNLLSGITSEHLLKKLASAGGKEVQSWAASLRNANVSYGKIRYSDNSPGTSFRSADTDIHVYTHIEDVSDQAKVERLFEVSSRRLGAHELFDCNDSRKHYVGNQKKHSASDPERDSLATLFGWSNGKRTTQKQEEHRIQKNKQDTGNKSKAPTKEETSLEIMHTKQRLHEQRTSEMPLSLRQRFSKTSLSVNHNDSFRRKSPRSPSTNHGLSDHCGNDFDGAVSPAISTSCSPSRSFSQSPGASSPSISARFTCFFKKNGSMPISSKTSVKDGSEDGDDVPVGSDRRPPQGAINQYFCFGIGDLPVENDRSRQRTTPVNSDLGQVGQLPDWLECPQMAYSMI